MLTHSTMLTGARPFAKNPLGIIALFIVLVYAVASAVVASSKPEFYEHPYHPAVLFLCVFPIFVLVAFVYLVTRYHRNLYAPTDYKNQADFFFGLKIPSALSADRNAVATSDRNEKPAGEAITATIEARYNEWVSFGFSLLHKSEVIHERTSPKSGRFYTRIWVEPMDRSDDLEEIASVTYRVWNDFRKPVRSTTDAASNFDLWISIYGEFPVLAIVQTKSGKTFELQRYIDLPGRPPD